MSLINILKQLFLIAILLAIVLGALTYFGLLGIHVGFSWFCLIYFTAITALMLSLASLSKDAKKNTNKVSALLGSMTLKFILSLLVVLAYAIIFKPDSIYFVIPFFIFYFIFTIVGTGYLIKLTHSE